MLFYFLVFYLAVLLIFFIFKRVKFTSRQALLLGIGASAVGIIVANFMTNKYQIFIVAILFAINVVFFWTIRKYIPLLNPCS
jgi:hypothetical protein